MPYKFNPFTGSLDTAAGSGGVPEAPSDGNLYDRKSGQWVQPEGSDVTNFPTNFADATLITIDGTPTRLHMVVGSIGDYAFDGDTSLTNLYLGESCTSIGSQAFYYCSGFTGSLTIPNSVTNIGDYAFRGCTGFTGSLTIPNSVTSIGSQAFRDCFGFTGSLTIPNSVTSIGDYAFDGTGFTSLTIAGTTSIGSGAFRYCGFNGLNVTGTSVNNNQFYNADLFTGSLTIADTVTSIGSNAFYAANTASGFTGDLTIPNSVTSIGYGAFNNLAFSGGTLTIPNSVTSIDGFAFAFTGFTTVLCYVTKTIFDVADQIFGSGVTTIRVRATDGTWTAGAGQTIGGKEDITVIKDL